MSKRAFWLVLLLPVSLAIACGKETDDTGDTDADTDTDTDSDTDADADSDADTDTSPPDPVLTWCGLDRPAELVVDPGADSALVYGMVEVLYYTDSAGPSAVITGQLGYGALDSDASGAGWTWADASFTDDVDDRDEYAAALHIADAGTYAYAFRFSVDGGGNWLYCDLGGNRAADAYDPDDQGVALVARDADGDGYYSAEDLGDDCDDGDAGINPGADDIPLDGIDQDCSGDDALPSPEDLLPGDLVITEVMADPDAVDDRYGEWFEIYNASGEIVDLMGLLVYDATSELFEVTASVVVEAEGVAVFARSADSGVNGGVTVDYAFSGMVLANNGDAIVLDNGTEALDEVLWDDTWPGGTGVAMALDPASWDAVSNDDASAWCFATQAYGDGDLGTPGTANDTCVPDDIDVDDDGYDDVAWGGTDCDDTDPMVYPGADEYCNGYDDNCDGTVDEDTAVDATTWYADVDMDGYGDAASSVTTCAAGSGYVADNTDCDDTDATIYPGATEVLDDGIDQDCDGVDSTSAPVDADADGFDDTVDCDDADATIYPGAAETCGDGIDQDCDGADLACPVDADADGFDDTVDCNDADATIYPGAAETCGDGIDQDCDGSDLACTCTVALADLLVGDLVITEIIPNPAVVADADAEWFEVYNASGCEADLEGLVVSDNASTFTVAGSLVVTAGDFVVFGLNADASTNDGAAVDYEYSGPQLGNSGDNITLNNGAIDIDEVIYTSSWPYASGYSMALDPTMMTATDNDDVANWCAATALYGVDNYGTPGAANGSCF
ncbi:MAG: MopE-related protein [Pseudomonadota bacterium]